MMNDWNWKKRSPPFVPVSGWSSSLVMKKYSWFASLLALAYLFLSTSKSDVGLFCNNNKYTCYTCICIMIIKLHETLPNETLRMMTNTLYTKIIWFDYYRNDNKAVNFNQLVLKSVLQDKFSSTNYYHIIHINCNLMHWMYSTLSVKEIWMFHSHHSQFRKCYTWLIWISWWHITIVNHTRHTTNG